MNISFTLASRKRLWLLELGIRSVFDLAYWPDLVEMNIMYDSDDLPTEELLFKLKEQYPNIRMNKVEITPQMRQDGLNLHHLFVNPGARLGTGKFIWVTGNDVEIKTQYYDKIVVEEAEQFLQNKPDRLCYIQINDDLKIRPIPGMCCFPIVSKESVETINGIMPDEIYAWGADAILYQIYMSILLPRILDLSNKISVWHWSYSTGRVHQGKIAPNMDAWDGDEISYSLQPKIRLLTKPQFTSYINKLNQRILQYAKTN